MQEENDAWLLAQMLTDLEASTAAQLFEAATALDVYDSHLKVYKDVARQADVFWDQLALYLPVARGPLVHKLIELAHQTLLQGIADLDQAAILANEALRRTERSANDLTDRFDRTFTERELPDERSIRYRQSIRSSLTDTGYIDDVTREANRVAKDAEQVQRSYTTLLQGIAHAFDERRVRGTDVLDQVSFALGLLVVALIFLPEALNALFADPVSFPHRRLVLLGKAGTVGLLLTLPWVVLNRWRLSTLGSWRFRRRHKQLRKFLANCATDHLTRLRDDGWKRIWAKLAYHQRAWVEFFAEWDDYDRDVACRCANILDMLFLDEALQPNRSIKANPGRLAWRVKRWLRRTRTSRWSDEDLDRLAWRVERWASGALLVSERPREFWEFALPRLTFLYRFHPMIGDELGSNSLEATESDIVSDSDFKFTVINQCSGRPDDIDTIKRWAQRQVEQSRSRCRPATHFVNALNEVGLKAGMTREDFKTMLNKMDEQLPSAPRSVADSTRIVGTTAHFDHSPTLDK